VAVLSENRCFASLWSYLAFCGPHDVQTPCVNMLATQASARGRA